MQKFIVAVGSHASLTDELVKEWGVKVYPYLITFADGESVWDTPELDRKNFYKKVWASKKLPTTSSQNAEKLKIIINEAISENKDVIFISLSPKLSPEGNLVLSVAKELNTNRVFVINSQAAAGTVTILTKFASELAKKEIETEKAITAIENLKNQIGEIHCIQNLNQLAKSGRIGKVSAYLGSTLKIKPIITYENGIVVPFKKTRTINQAIEGMKEYVIMRIKKGNFSKIIYYCFINIEAENTIELLRKEVFKEFGQADYLDLSFAGVVSIHTGSGIFSMAFLME